MAMTLITTNTSSNAATSSFTTGIDDTYKLYVFKFYDINPATDSSSLTFQVNADGQSGYNETITSTNFLVVHYESGSSSSGPSVEADADQAQGTAFQPITHQGGNASDESSAGELFLFNPSNSTYVTHFYSSSVTYYATPAPINLYVSGYINTATAIDDIQFKMSSGNFDGTIKMYGVG